MEYKLIWLALYMVIGFVLASNDKHLPDLEAVTDARGFDRFLSIIFATLFILAICFATPIFLVWNALLRKTT